MYETKIGGIELINEASDLIKSGEVVAFPTETVYGLGANALDKNAVKKIFIAKNRPSDNPLIVHVANIEQAKRFAYVNKDAKNLFDKFSPGPLTIVLPKKSIVPAEVTGDIQTVGIRIPDNKIALELIRISDCPLAAPSANTSKKVSPTTAQHVLDDMNGKIPLILDGGECKVGIESTVLSLAEEIPTILRPGGITIEMLTEVLPRVKNHTGEIKVAQAPGMKYKHYAPTVEECIMFDDISNGTKYYDNVISKGKKAIMVVTTDTISKIGKRNFADVGNSGEDVAHNVFRVLRECEKKYDCILIQKLPSTGIYASVMNRLTKSTSDKTV
ncbi:MAG TPA: L-threonylcarbamoyladenylate synthase [Clostridia bacterium]|nr:L-threonylcarbamoyladenylate synthase [Clostridia bacterium]